MSFDFNDERTCNQCGRVAVAVSRVQAETQVKEFNTWLDAADEKTRASYNSPASLASYEACVGCGNLYTNFRDSAPDDCPPGCTLNEILRS